MRPYIILNGKRSTLIRGLMICSLPPVTKPQLRTQVTTIDGRDGEIVTPVGYSAYSKEFEIGLYGGFDIDEVIGYFNSSGTVTFSNEPSKYYNYRIDNQIDLEKLIRFRKANVIMRVQPFKYSLDEPAIVITQEMPVFPSAPWGSISSAGVTVFPDGEYIKIAGTASAKTELYIPIEPVEIDMHRTRFSGNCAHILSVYTEEASGTASVRLKLIHDTPVDSNSFGGRSVTLADNAVVMISAILPEKRIFNFIHLYIPAGASISAKIRTTIKRADGHIVREFRNAGNCKAKPRIRITGRGTICVFMNITVTAGMQPADSSEDMVNENIHYLYVGNEPGWIYGGRYSYNDGWSCDGIHRNFIKIVNNDENYIIIDTDEQEAYVDAPVPAIRYIDSPTGRILKNRSVKGEYPMLAPGPGVNYITAIGGVRKIEIEKYSRWL